MGESRSVLCFGIQASTLMLPAPRNELLAWLNNLLQLNITKVEQCGTGYAFPSRVLVKFNRQQCV